MQSKDKYLQHCSIIWSIIIIVIIIIIIIIIHEYLYRIGTSV